MALPYPHCGSPGQSRRQGVRDSEERTEGNPPGGGPSCTTGMSLTDCAARKRDSLSLLMQLTPAPLVHSAPRASAPRLWLQLSRQHAKCGKRPAHKVSGARCASNGAGTTGTGSCLHAGVTPAQRLRHSYAQSRNPSLAVPLRKGRRRVSIQWWPHTLGAGRYETSGFSALAQENLQRPWDMNAMRFAGCACSYGPTHCTVVRPATVGVSPDRMRVPPRHLGACSASRGAAEAVARPEVLARPMRRQTSWPLRQAAETAMHCATERQ